jgi:hypothetical protein
MSIWICPGAMHLNFGRDFNIRIFQNLSLPAVYSHVRRVRECFTQYSWQKVITFGSNKQSFLSKTQHKPYNNKKCVLLYLTFAKATSMKCFIKILHSISDVFFDTTNQITQKLKLGI